MGCCCSKRPDPSSEKGQFEASTESLRSEINNTEFVPDAPQMRQGNKHKSRVSKKRSESLTINTSSSRTSSRLLSIKSASTKGYHPDSPNSHFNDNFLKKILKTPVEENFKTIKILRSAFHGNTLLANDKRTSLKKVIKEVKKSAIQKKEEEILIMEAQKFQWFDHPNVVKLHEVYESEEKWCLVYECFFGSNLLEIAQNEIIGYSLTSSVMRDILSGLNYCHNNGILHLGLNLEKIILDSKDGKINCKIIGFSYPWELKGLVKYNKVVNSI